MNVLFLSELYFPHGGGAEYATHLYAELFSSRGHCVTVITNQFPGEPSCSKNRRLTVYRLPIFKESKNVKYSVLRGIGHLFSNFLTKKIRWSDVICIPRYWYSAIPLIKTQRKPVILHLHDYIIACPLANLYDATTKAICNRSGNLVCSPRCVYAYEQLKGSSFASTFFSMAFNTTIGHYLGWLAGLSDAIICVSEAQLQSVVKDSPSLKSKAHVIYNPLPDIPYVPLEGDDFAYFGGNSPLKGYEILLKALMHLETKGSIVHAAGFGGHEVRVSNLKNVNLNKYEWVTGGILDDIYRRSRAVVVPSVCPEPLPYIVYEALLRGRLVIASRIGGIPEQVDGHSGCFLFSPGKHEELQNMMERALSIDREEIVRIGIQNRARLLKKNQNEDSLERFIRIAHDLL